MPILLINPNTNVATTRMMAEIGRDAAPVGWTIETATAERGVGMIVDGPALAVSAEEVLRIGLERAHEVAGIVVGAFGDPGLDALRQRVAVPVTGLCEASMHEASEDGRRFGVATVTPGLVAAIDARATAGGFATLYTGIRLTEDDPLVLTGDEPALREALADAIERCIRLDGAEAVIIGGGPLARAATELQGRFAVPIVEPVPAAIRRMVRLLGDLRR